MNELEDQVRALLQLVARVGAPLTARDGLWATPFRPAGRKHTKPWAVAADVRTLCLVVLADDGEAGRFPLAGSTLLDAGTVLAETVWAHVGVELADEIVVPGDQPHEIKGDFRFGGLDPAALRAFALHLDAAQVAAWVAR